MQTNEVTPEHAASARWTGRQFHNQPEQSHQHQFLLDLWSDVRAETGGRVAVSVHAQNAGVPGSDPQALDMLQSGELEFMTLMGGILGRAVPATEIQGLPFAFTSHAQVHAVNEGALGAYLDEECRAKGIHRFRHGLLENGFRHIGMTAKPINNAEDLVGVVMRVPDGQMFRDLFTALEAKPVVVNINGLYDALASGRVDGQENPLVVTEVNKLYEVTRFMSLTSHMWSGFNLIANRAFWDGLPGDVQAVIDRHVQKARATPAHVYRWLQPRARDNPGRARHPLQQGRYGQLPGEARRRLLSALARATRRDGMAASRGGDRPPRLRRLENGMVGHAERVCFLPLPCRNEWNRNCRQRQRQP